MPQCGMRGCPPGVARRDCGPFARYGAEGVSPRDIAAAADVQLAPDRSTSGPLSGLDDLGNWGTWARRDRVEMAGRLELAA
jgi:hypothetical protein